MGQQFMHCSFSTSTASISSSSMGRSCWIGRTYIFSLSNEWCQVLHWEAIRPWRNNRKIFSSTFNILKFKPTTVFKLIGNVSINLSLIAFSFASSGIATLTSPRSWTNNSAFLHVQAPAGGWSLSDKQINFLVRHFTLDFLLFLPLCWWFFLLFLELEPELFLRLKVEVKWWGKMVCSSLCVLDEVEARFAVTTAVSFITEFVEEFRTFGVVWVTELLLFVWFAEFEAFGTGKLRNRFAKKPSNIWVFFRHL